MSAAVSATRALAFGSNLERDLENFRKSDLLLTSSAASGLNLLRVGRLWFARGGSEIARRLHARVVGSGWGGGWRASGR